jgi:hypothetical protein
VIAVNANPSARPWLVVAGRRLGTPRLALVFGGLALLAVVCIVPLALLAHQASFFNVGVIPPVCAVFAVVGAVVAQHESRNPVGWTLLAFGLLTSLSADAGFYSVVRYRLGHTGLPLGQLAAFLAPEWVPLIVFLPLPIALFPDGRMSTRFWRVTLWLYCAVAAVLLTVVGLVGLDGVLFRPIRVDSSGEVNLLDHASGVWETLNRISNVCVAPYLLLSLAWIIRQVVAYRRSTGESRQQRKALMTGGALCIVGIVTALVTGNAFGTQAVSDAGVLLLTALPISIGVGVLKYRLYEIDRLISRTISYLIITGLLVGVFIGVVVLATDVLPFSSPVGVAASTLAAAALFNPLRLRVQRLVDRRFNRGRYDAEAIVAAFTMRLRDAVDLDAVRGELLQAVNGAVQPAHASVWIRPLR